MKPMSLDVAELMKSLASKRTIFHSEADFRNELAKGRVAHLLWRWGRR